jgi:murein DD-endopeptidase MepM/ murein hydrolase activator NlpD
MIKPELYNNTLDVLDNLFANQGGALFFNTVQDGILVRDTSNYKTAAKIPTDYKEFSISIYNVATDKDVSKLILYVNPKDLAIGQLHVFNSAYTRRGWVNTAWGNQQATLSASGVSSGFYFYDGSRGGVTNYSRRKSPSFINIFDVVAMFKNNGWYFLNGVTNPSLFKDGTSRVISVMDCIKIEYDGSTYIGSFDTLTLNDVAEKPYNMEYSFEFVVSSFGTDLQGVDGHLSRDNNKSDNEVKVAIQGFNIGFKTVIGLDAEENNKYFPPDSIPEPSLYDYKIDELREELDYYSKSGETSVVAIPEGVFKVTRGWIDGETHGGKCDFRTHTGYVYAATEGEVYKVRKSYVKGGSNYIIVKSDWGGTPIYVRYYHLNTDSISLNPGDYVVVGERIGREGTDGGAYPQHCDFEVKKIVGTNPDYVDCQRIECSPILDAMWNKLHSLADIPEYSDFKTLVNKHEPRKYSL